MISNQIVRTCNGCTLCCKVMEIDELAKPPQQWCPNCAVGSGCKIYSSRPPSCAVFTCGYLSMPGLGEHWRPSKCKMVITLEDEGRMIVRTDAGHPSAWRAEPFYSELKYQAQRLGSRFQILVQSNGRTIAVVPDRDIDLGVVTKDHMIITAELEGGRRWHVEKMMADDPRIAGHKINQWIDVKIDP